MVALTRTQTRLGDLSLLLIGIRSPDREANLRYAEALTQKLRALPPSVVNLATYHVRDVRAFFEQNKWLYVSEADLESIRDRLRTEISKRKNPLYISLDDDPESVESMRQRMSGKSGLDEKFPGGVFESKGAGGDYVWIAALPPGGLFVENAGEALLNAANDLIKADPPARYHPEMKVEPAGPIVTGIASRHAVERDILWVTITCLIARRDLDRPLLPALAGDPADRHPGRDGNGDGVRGGRAGVRLPQLVDGLPGLDHHRQRHQLRDHADVALRGAPGRAATIPRRRCAARWAAPGAGRWSRRSRRRRPTRR